MSSSLWQWWIAGLCVTLAGCGGPEYTGAERYALSGKVTYDGEPIDLGSIAFLPAGGGDQRVSGGEIVNGAYSIDEPRGANAGTYRIQIRWQKKTGRQVRDPGGGEMVDERVEGLPAKFHDDSELTVDVSPAQTTFDFHLKSE
jgi:hypothetical protein